MIKQIQMLQEKTVLWDTETVRWLEMDTVEYGLVYFVASPDLQVCLVLFRKQLIESWQNWKKKENNVSLLTLLTHFDK